MNITIREVIETDARAIAKIYAHHVRHGTASYEVVPPTIDETLAKIRAIGRQRSPFLVAEANGLVAGYAYVTQFRDRPAYRFTAEDSIYIDAQRTGSGIGKQLLGALLDHSAARGFQSVVAVIGGAEPASIGLHRSLGFAVVGRLERVGFKFGRWLDNVYMQRHLGDDRTRQEFDQSLPQGAMP